MTDQTNIPKNLEEEKQSEDALSSVRQSLIEVNKDADALVQVGTNLSMVGLADEAERWLGKPVIAINTATYWYSLRQNGIKDRIDGFGALLAFECGRARAHYLRAQGVLAPEDRAALAPAEAMRRIYARLLDHIEKRQFDVFGPRITLASHEKIALALRAWAAPDPDITVCFRRRV